MELRQGGGFVPGVDEVAKQAYIMYVNQGSLPGHDVEHWLEAEARLFAEANVSRTFEFQDQQ